MTREQLLQQCKQTLAENRFLLRLLEDNSETLVQLIEGIEQFDLEEHENG